MNVPGSILAVALTVPAIITAAGILTVFVSRPLIHGKVSRNRMYGIRTPRAFESEEAWLRINRAGGAILSRWGWLTVFVGLAGFPVTWIGVREMVAYNIIATMLILGSLLAATIRILQLR